MSYSNETTYYGLPLPTGSDKSTFTDNNTAFQAVDAALHTAAEGAAQAAEDITSLTSRVGTAEDDIDALELDLGTEKGKIEALQNKETLQDAAIDDVRSDCEGMVSAYNEPTATSTHAYVAGDYFIYNDVLYQATDAIAIGDTIVPNTNCSTTTVAEELAEVNEDIAQVNSNLADVIRIDDYQKIETITASATGQSVSITIPAVADYTAIGVECKTTGYNGVYLIGCYLNSITEAVVAVGSLNTSDVSATVMIRVIRIKTIFN